jgi:hypothetical protein
VMAQGVSVGPQQEDFFSLQQCMDLILSHRLGLGAQVSQVGAGAQWAGFSWTGFSQHELLLPRLANRAFNLSRQLALEQPQLSAFGPQQSAFGVQHPWAGITIGGSPHAPAWVTSAPEARADESTSIAAFITEFLRAGLSAPAIGPNIVPLIAIDVFIMNS